MAKKEPDYKYYVGNLDNGNMIVVQAKNKSAAKRWIQKDISERWGRNWRQEIELTVDKATPEDVDWVKSMGGYVEKVYSDY